MPRSRQDVLECRGSGTTGDTHTGVVMAENAPLTRLVTPELLNEYWGISWLLRHQTSSETSQPVQATSLCIRGGSFYLVLIRQPGQALHPHLPLLPAFTPQTPGGCGWFFSIRMVATQQRQCVWSQALVSQPTYQGGFPILYLSFHLPKS